MPNDKKISEIRDLLQKRYPSFFALAEGERVLLAMSVLANDIKVREKGGANSGEWVEAILASSGLGKGYPWCAASIEFCCDVAQVTQGPTKGTAAVINWYRWAKANGRLREKPQRGRLCLWLNQSGTGHIGIVAGIRDTDGMIVSYEGNTSSGESGSQRDGDGLYKRLRRESVWAHYIELDDSPDA